MVAQNQLNGASTIHVHNEVELPKNNPVPITFGGEALTTINGQQYIPFFAPDDNLFRTLLELRLLSTTQAACILDKRFYCAGTGVVIKGRDFPPDFDKKINGKRQTLDDIMVSIFDGLLQDGNSFIEVVRTEVAGKKYVHAYINNNMDCRFEFKDDGSDPTHVIRSKTFRKDGYVNWGKTDKPIRIPLWTDDPIKQKSVWLKKGGVERTMIHIKNEVLGIDHYGMPSNFSGFMQAVQEFRAASFNADNFENSMFLSGILFLQGNLGKEEELQLVKQMKQLHTGEGKKQRVLTVSSEQGVQETKFLPFNEQKDGHFIEFDKHNEEKIIGANQWSRTLLDMRETGSLGKGAEYLKSLFLMKYQTVIKPIQANVLNNFVFPLMQIIDEYKGTKFYDEKWIIEPVIPVTLEGLIDINSLLTVDEGRAEMGREPMGNEKGGMLISEVAAKAKQPAEGAAPKK